MNATMYMLPVEKLVLAKETDLVEKILDVMREGHFKTLPVVDQNQYFIGVIQASDLYEGYFNECCTREEFLNCTIKEFIRRDIEKINKNADFLQVILSMEKMDIHFLPCVDDYQRFLGIVTRNNIFQAFESAFGYNEDGYLIEVVSIDAKGQLAKLAKCISQADSNIISTLHFDHNIANLERIILKVQTNNIELVLAHISDEGFRINHCKFVPKLAKSQV